MVRLWIAAITAAALAAGPVACGRDADHALDETLVWRTVGTWSGHGSAQTKSFPSDSGMLRVAWQTTGDAGSRVGTFRVVLHSAVSGRMLVAPVDVQGVGSGTADTAQDPRLFYLRVESADIHWQLTVSERVSVLAAEDSTSRGEVEVR